MNEKKNFFQDTLRPVIVLVVICLAASALLGVTNAVTEPIIAENEAAAALKDRQELLPDALSFTEIPYDANEHVKSVYTDDGGSGMIVTVGMTGYGGVVTTTVAIGPDGGVLQIRVNANTETKGVGTKVTLPDFTDLFVGQTKDSFAVSVISGATYSSKTVIDSVSLALEVFGEVGGVK